MIKLIIDEYNKWGKDPTNYLNASLYKNGYDPYFPPMQIIGNLLDSKIINHLNNEGFTNPYGLVGGRTDGVIGGAGAYQQSSGLWWQDLMIKGNSYNSLISSVPSA